MAGWIKIHRKITEWEWYSDINVCRLFTHLLFTANYEDKNWQGQIIKAGQLVTGKDSLSSQTGLSGSQVRTALEKLKSSNEIAIKITNKYSIITICNWLKYQHDDSQDSRQIADKSQTNRRQIADGLAATKEDKNLRKEEEKKVSKQENASLFAEKLIPQGVSQELWEAFLKARKDKRATNTDYALALLMKKLDAFHKDGNDRAEVIQQSITRGWIDVFPIKDQASAGGATQTTRKSFQQIKDDEYEENKRIAKEIYERENS